MPEHRIPEREGPSGYKQPGEQRASETGAAYDEPLEATGPDDPGGRRPGLGSEATADESGAPKAARREPGTFGGD
jgi:hypothetical protein